MSPLRFENTFSCVWDHRDRLGKSGSLETFAEEKAHLNLKPDFSLENVVVMFLKYIFRSLGSPGQIGDIGQFGNICGRKK